MNGDRSRLFGGIFLVGFGTLLLEVALTRVLSFTIWYHFAYVVIATALLGYGAAGSLLAARPEIGTRDLPATLTRLCVFAGLTGSALLLFFCAVPLHPMEILARPGQAWTLVAYQLAATVPFFFAGLAISLALRAAADQVDRLYFWDLTGAGLGCAAAVPFMNQLSPPGTVLVGGAAFCVAAWRFGGDLAWRRGALAFAAAAVLVAPWAQDLPFVPARSKHIVRQSELGVVPLTREWTALFRTDLVAVPAPFPNWTEFGLGRRVDLVAQQPSHYVHHDGTAGAGIYDLRQGPMAFLDSHAFQLPYLAVAPGPRVLVIGVGGGRDILAALHYGASHVTGIELDPATVRLVREDLNEESLGAFQRPEVKLVAGEGRHFVRITQDRFDLIQLTGVDTLAAVFNGAYVLAENYLYTVGAVRDYLSRLEPDGLLSFATGDFDLRKPRSVGRMVLVAAQALRERGVTRPEDHIAVFRSNALLVAILVRPRPFEKAELDRLAAYAEKVGLPPLLLPGRPPDPLFGELVTATGSARDALLARLPYEIAPTTDDRPFFFKYFRWSELSLEEARSPVHTTALGQIVLLALLCTLTVLGLLLILGPLLLLRRRPGRASARATFGVLLYFVSLGLGFMLFEISLIQRFVLFLGYPTYSLSVILFSLLIFLGLGSFLSRRWVGRERVALPSAVAALAVLAAFYVYALPVLQAPFLGTPLLVRVALTVLVLAPLGLVMGIFFPIGIRRAADLHEDLVPWAWGINGCASVTATVLTVILAMTYGFGPVWVLSVVIYGVGVAALLLLAPRTAS